MITGDKKVFLLNEIWMLAVAGAFQRANIYALGIPEIEKQKFKNFLKKQVIEISDSYTSTVTSEQHILNIHKICQPSEFSTILNNGCLSFGSGQKLLNLYLKYLWSLSLIPEPPHFPVDRIIQEKLKIKTLFSWTKRDEFGETQYHEIIKAARDIAAKEFKTLAVLEMELFNRRSNS
jgi:hypothetical protein